MANLIVGFHSVVLCEVYPNTHVDISESESMKEERGALEGVLVGKQTHFCCTINSKNSLDAGIQSDIFCKKERHKK
jgi:hypothetical protein